MRVVTVWLRLDGTSGDLSTSTVDSATSAIPTGGSMEDSSYLLSGVCCPAFCTMENLWYIELPRIVSLTLRGQAREKQVSKTQFKYSPGSTVTDL